VQKSKYDLPYENRLLLRATYHRTCRYKNMLIDLGSESNVSSLITKRKMQRVFKLEPRFPAIQFSLYFVIGEQKTVPQFCQKVFSFWTLGH